MPPFSARTVGLLALWGGGRPTAPSLRTLPPLATGLHAEELALRSSLERCV